MTGRALGFCAGYGQPGYAAAGPGMGMGRGGAGGRGGGWGRGGGRGMRWGAGGAYGTPVAPAAYAPPVYGPAAYGPAAPPPAPAVDEQTMLQQQRDFLQAQLARIEAQLNGLDTRESED